ncbi:ANK REP REGION domain-containing protein [Citrus sinensis]|uniref:ANK REP REGION domain-containing protein n=1 Tax=Citrus sinensis TaxID=2711 RepID=A0ACB8MZ62_CITSI|nr:ANK REP REGION domain-containing protein [Citrus sinensis]
MDPHFFKAAAAGNSEPFKDMAGEVIESLLTAKIKNTILHINIISQERENLSTKFVEEILEKCPSLLLQVNAKGDTPLHVAAKFGHSDMVRFLVERAKLPQHENEELESGVGAAKQMIRMTNNEKNTALHEAACCENVDVVKILTKEDPDYPYSANNYGKTPLYMAAESSSSDMVLALLENSTPVSHEGPNGKTALHAAAMEFRFGPSPTYLLNITSTMSTKRRCAPTLNHGVGSSFDSRETSTVDRRQIDYYLMGSRVGKSPGRVWVWGCPGPTRMSHIVTRIRTVPGFFLCGPADAALRKLLEEKKNMIKETDQYGWTPIHYAAYYGNYEMVNLLLEIDQSASNIANKDRKMTALHLAAGRGHARTVETILSLTRSLINEGDAMENTPLHVLAAVRPKEFHAVMIKKTQANYDAVNKRNVSVRHIFSYGYPKLKEEIQKLSKDFGRGQYSNGVICKSELEYIERQNDDTKDDYKDTRESHLVVAALIATVAFAAAFTIPGGYRSENGTAILRRNKAFQAFIVADSIAMVFSLSAVFTHFLMSLKIEATKDFDGALFGASLWLTLFSMGAMVIAFVTGTYAMLVPSLGLAIITCLIGLSFFLLVIWIMGL